MLILKFLQSLKLKFAKVDKQGSPTKFRGVEKISKKW